MKKCKTLKMFCREVMRLVGCGYKYAKCVKLKETNEDKILEYLYHIDIKYEIDKTRSAKAWNRHKEIANIDAVFFEPYNFLFIAKTNGAIHPNLDKKGVRDFHFEKVENLVLDITENISLKMYKQVTTKEEKAKAKEKGKAPKFERWTFKLEYETFRRIKAEYFNAIAKGDGKHFHALQKKWKGLPNYVGIGIQRTNINTFIKELFKKYSRKWEISF